MPVNDFEFHQSTDARREITIAEQGFGQTDDADHDRAPASVATIVSVHGVCPCVSADRPGPEIAFTLGRPRAEPVAAVPVVSWRGRTVLRHKPDTSREKRRRTVQPRQERTARRVDLVGPRRDDSMSAVPGARCADSAVIMVASSDVGCAPTARSRTSVQPSLTTWIVDAFGSLTSRDLKAASTCPPARRRHDSALAARMGPFTCGSS